MTLSTVVLGTLALAFAQHPAVPEPDHAPAPLPMEGKKKMEPARGKERPHGSKAIPKPPVAPPVPDPNKVDPIK